MGVGAMFISTLALSRLPQPHNPPRSQQELLAATLQIIVSFIVLGSIIICEYSGGLNHVEVVQLFSDGLSIPLFSFGRSIHTRSISLTRIWTSRQLSQPDWLLMARRASPPVPTVNVDGQVGATRTASNKDGDLDPESGDIGKMVGDHDVTVNQACA
jgi:sodium/hydrogen antiporter